MKTATCALVADTSKFDGPLDKAKSKLQGLGSAIQQVGSLASRGLSAWDSLQDIATRINTFEDQINNLVTAYGKLSSIVPNLSSAFEKFKGGATATGTALGRVIVNNENLVKKFIDLAGKAAQLYVSFLTLKAIFNIYVGAAKAVINATVSIASGITNLATSAARASINMAKIAGGAISKGFSAIGSAVGVASKGLAVLGISIGGLDAFFKTGIVSAFQMGDELKTLRDRTGASIPFIYDLQKAFKNAGMSGDSVAPVLQSMGRALTGVNSDGEPTNKMFERLKLNVDDLKSMSPEQQFKTIAGEIGKLSSPAERAAASMAIFGRSAGALTAVIAEGNIDKLGQNMTGPAKVLAENADTFSQISIQLRKSGETFKGFFIMIAGKIGAPLLAIMKAFEGGTFLEGVGEKIGNVLGGGLTIFANAIKEGKIFDLLREGFITAIMVSGDTLLRYMSASIDAIVEMWKSGLIQNGVSALISGFASATQIMGGYLLKIFQAPVVYLQAGIQLAVEKLLEGLGKIPVLGEKLGLSGFTAGSFGGIKKGIEEGGGASFFGATADEMISAGKEGFSKATDTLTSVATAGAKVFSDSLASQGEMIKGTEDQLKKFGDLTGSLSTPIEGLKTSAGQAGVALQDGTALGAVESAGKSKQAEAAVSSLQRIGGGGGAFGGDPMLKNSEKQTILQEKMVALMEEQKKKSEAGGGSMAGSFSYAVLA